MGLRVCVTLLVSACPQLETKLLALKGTLPQLLPRLAEDSHAVFNQLHKAHVMHQFNLRR